MLFRSKITHSTGSMSSLHHVLCIHFPARSYQFPLLLVIVQQFFYKGAVSNLFFLFLILYCDRFSMFFWLNKTWILVPIFLFFQQFRFHLTTKIPPNYCFPFSVLHCILYSFILFWFDACVFFFQQFQFSRLAKMKAFSSYDEKPPAPPIRFSSSATRENQVINSSLHSSPKMGDNLSKVLLPNQMMHVLLAPLPPISISLFSILHVLTNSIFQVVGLKPLPKEPEATKKKKTMPNPFMKSNILLL